MHEWVRHWDGIPASKPGSTYRISLSATPDNFGNHYGCTCRAWINQRHKKQGKCKHIIAFEAGAYKVLGLLPPNLEQSSRNPAPSSGTGANAKGPIEQGHLANQFNNLFEDF